MKRLEEDGVIRGYTIREAGHIGTEIGIDRWDGVGYEKRSRY